MSPQSRKASSSNWLARSPTCWSALRYEASSSALESTPPISSIILSWATAAKWESPAAAATSEARLNALRALSYFPLPAKMLPSVVNASASKEESSPRSSTATAVNMARSASANLFRKRKTRARVSLTWATMRESFSEIKIARALSRWASASVALPTSRRINPMLFSTPAKCRIWPAFARCMLAALYSIKAWSRFSVPPSFLYTSPRW